MLNVGRVFLVILRGEGIGASNFSLFSRNRVSSRSTAMLEWANAANERSLSGWFCASERRLRGLAR